MQFLKISCIKCSQYKECPKTTRLFVNYCGSDGKRVAKKITEATEDCRLRRGFLSMKNMFTNVTMASPLPDMVGGTAV